jgi:oligopeptide/dipeptide ABC transporter ATP-binding protein
MPELVELDSLRKEFPFEGAFLRGRKTVRAVDGVTLTIRQGEALGLVGESGSGKSTLARLVLKLIKPTTGSVHFNGEDIFKLKGRDLKNFRKKAQIVFQNPILSLNPALKICDMLSEPIMAHGIITGTQEARKKTSQLLNLVGLDQTLIDRYPHELSGGQMQRIAIARALSLNPAFIVFDEPTSNLDVSVQAQILNLIVNLKAKFNLTYLFISHNLSVVSHVSDRVAVMYAGKLVETAKTDEFFSEPKHPYSQTLLNSVSMFDPELKAVARLTPKGEPPSLLKPPEGCRFHPRCPFVMPICSQHDPELADLSSTRKAACFLYPEVMASS